MRVYREHSGAIKLTSCVRFRDATAHCAWSALSIGSHQWVGTSFRSCRASSTSAFRNIVGATGAPLNVSLIFCVAVIFLSQVIGRGNLLLPNIPLQATPLRGAPELARWASPKVPCDIFPPDMNI